MLVAEHIHFQVGQTTILCDVSIAVAAGEMVALCGPNGAGKSTLLKIISGEQEATKGTVQLSGQALSEWNPRNLAQSRAKLSQESELTFSFRASEVIES